MIEPLGELSADGYGIFVYSPSELIAFLKEKKSRSRKLLTYFDKNKDAFFEAISRGIILPFYKISDFEYRLSFSLEPDSPSDFEGFKEVYKADSFYLKVGSCETICFSSFNYLEYSYPKIKEGIYENGEQIPSGAESILEWYYSSRFINLSEGDYLFNLHGLAREEKLERQSKNYGFHFHIMPQTETTVSNNLEQCDNDKHIFEIHKHE